MGYTMKWIGLTGGIATGKSTVAELLRKKGLTVIDADKVAHEVVTPGSTGIEKISHTFGKEMIQSDGSLDRQKMAKEVFVDPQKLSQLESIIHPLVKAKVAELKKKCEEKNEKLVFYDVPLLFEKKLEKEFDKIVVVSSTLELQKQRMKNRNHWDEEEIQRRLSNQLSLKYKESGADFVIHNKGSVEELEAKVDLLVQELLK